MGLHLVHIVSFFLCIGFGFVHSLAAQSLAPRVLTRNFLETFSRKDYNASTQNWAVLQDHRGVMYVGNAQGVLEYNGYDWRLIEVDNQPTVRSIAMAADGTIFVGAEDELGYLAPDSLGLLRYRSLLAHIAENDRAFGDIWFTHTASGGVYFQGGRHLFRWSENEMEVWRPEVRFNTSALVRDTLYVHSYGVGLLRMENDSLVFVPGSEQFSEEWVFVMLPFDDSRIFLGTRDQGFFLFDGSRFEPFPTEVDEYLLKYTLYYPGAILDDGTIALNTMDGGLLIIDRQGRLVQHIGQNDGLPTDRVYYVYQDNEQGLWLAHSNGIARLEIPSPLSYIDDSMGLPQTILGLERYEGVLYAHTVEGLFVVDEENNAISPVEGASKSIWNMLATPNALFATTNGGLYLIRDRQVRYWELFRQQATQDYLAFSIHQSALDEQVLFVGRREGLDVIRYQLDRLDEWVLLGSIPGIDSQVNSIREIQAGQLRLGLNDGAIHLTYTDSTLLTPEMVRYGEEEGLTEGSVWVYEAAGTLFYATNEGLHSFAPENETFVRVDSLFPGISFEDAAVFADLSDGLHGDIWIAAKEGVYRALPDPNGGYAIQSAPFLRFADWTINSIHTDPEGIVWFGGIDGLVKYDERVPRPYEVARPPLIHRVTVGPDSLLFGGPGAPFTGKKRVLPSVRYQDNSIRFDYRAPLYDMPERVLYQSRLEGYEEGWSSLSEDAWRAYTNLHEGRYTFRVRARNAYGVMSEDTLFDFRILAPWWRTWWAYLAYGLLGAGGILTAYRLQHRRWLRKERQRAQIREARLEAEAAQALSREATALTRALRAENERKELELEKARQLEITNNELQRALKHLTDTQDQLIHSEKMASLGQLTAGIAHEIKNPLNFINNFAQISAEITEEVQALLEEEGTYLPGRNAEELKTFLNDLKVAAQKINQHGRRADAIIHSMLEHSRADLGDRRRIDINQLVDEYASLAYHGFRAREGGFLVELNRDYETPPPHVEVHPQEIGRVLINLLDNAFYAVGHRRHQEDESYVPRVWVTTKRLDSAVQVCIRDNGKGIPQEIRDKIFEPFFTTKPTGAGTGLGLSLSYDIVVKGHGGNLTIEPMDGPGATFVLQLPLDSEGAA